MAALDEALAHRGHQVVLRVEVALDVQVHREPASGHGLDPVGDELGTAVHDAEVLGPAHHHAPVHLWAVNGRGVLGAGFFWAGLGARGGCAGEQCGADNGGRHPGQQPASVNSHVYPFLHKLNRYVVR